MDRFDSMRVFTRVVERRSFTLAATDLGLPRSTVTDAVKHLEKHLGTRLLQRTTRHVSPTLDGEAYHRRCLSLIAELEDAESAFSGSTPKGPLRIDIHGILARNFLLPNLPAFLARYPEIDFYMGEGDRLVDLIREGVDCVIRSGELKDSDMIARRIAVMREATIASPAYIKRHGKPKTIDELTQGHRMIGFRSSATGTVLPLEFTVKAAGKDGAKETIRHVTLPTSLTVNGAESLVAAARLGLGLIQVPRYHLEAEIKRGDLIEILPQHPPTSTPVSLLYPRSRQLSPRVRVFIDWVTEVFKDK